MSDDAVPVSCLAFCRDDYLISDIAKCQTYLLLAVRIGVRGIIIIDPALISSPKELYRIIFFASLKRKTAHCGLCDQQL